KNARVPQMAIDSHENIVELDQFFQKAGEIASGDFAFRLLDLDSQILCSFLKEKPTHLALVFDVLLGPAPLELEQGRLRNVDVSAIDEFAHLPVEERQQEGSNMGSVDVRVGHNDDFVVAKLRDIEVFLSDTRTERRDHRDDLLMRQHFVVSRLFDVQDL